MDILLQIIDLLEDASPDAEAPYEGKLKDALRFMGKRSKNMLFASLMEEEEMKNIHPVRSTPSVVLLLLQEENSCRIILQQLHPESMHL